MTRRLIEDWLPIAALGMESLRERTPMTPFPAPNRLHVWWARRPLVASRAAILASLLPADADRDCFRHAIGIHGDPAASRRRIDAARRRGERFDGDAYSYKRAFTYSLSADELAWFAEEMGKVGIVNPVVLDPTAGGGSIPFEAQRLGATTIANDLNPVAALILNATVIWPAKFGMAVHAEYRRVADEFVRRREDLLAPHFPAEPDPDAISTNFIWARTITCPYCDGLIPLSPNWRLAPDGTGVRLHPHDGPDGRRCRFEVVQTARQHSEGTVARGAATCPFPDCGRVVDGDEIKRQAQAGGMGDQLFAIVFKRRVLKPTKTGRKRETWERGYRAPRPEDDNVAEIRRVLADKLPDWEALDLVPTEPYDDMYCDRSKVYGVYYWRDLFSPRQFLGHALAVEVFRKLLAEEEAKGELPEARRAAFVYLALSLDKLRDYNSRMTRWHVNREVMVNTFDRHDFSFKWSYAEMAPLIAGLGFDWAIEQTAKCVAELVELSRPDVDVKQAIKGGRQSDMLSRRPSFAAPDVIVTCQSGDELGHLADGSVDAVVVDPPYYDNVMYAELSDFFYVWLKRTAGHVYPELFRRPLADKEREAVANPMRFRGQKGARELAARDYRDRMASIFREARRVLTPDGVMTLMFTHKATGAWDALTVGLMEAGFVVTASWPVNTEAEGSMHIKDKSAANSTVLLVCRPRPPRAEGTETYWEELEPEVRRAVATRIGEFQAAGIRGVDLYLSAFGPALEVFSRAWPVRRGQPRQLPEGKRRRQATLLDEAVDLYAATPEDALDAARREVKRWRLDRLVNVQRKGELDPLTEWFILAWDAFEAPQFPYDEALRLARVVGLDVDRDIVNHVCAKKASDLVMWDSSTRAASGTLGPANGSVSMLDAIHHAAHAARTRSVAAAKELIDAVGLSDDPGFLAALEAVLEVLPLSRAYTGFDPVAAAEPAASDFEALENLRRLAFGDAIDEPRQLSLLKEEAA